MRGPSNYRTFRFDDNEVQPGALPLAHSMAAWPRLLRPIVADGAKEQYAVTIREFFSQLDNANEKGVRRLLSDAAIKELETLAHKCADIGVEIRREWPQLWP